MSETHGRYVRTWDSAPVHTPHPAPLIACREARDEELPTSARRLRDKAQAAGWQVQVTFSRGTSLGRDTPVVDSVVVRLQRGPQRAFACWKDGKPDGCGLIEHTWGRLVNLTQLSKAVAEPVPDPCDALRHWCEQTTDEPDGGFTTWCKACGQTLAKVSAP